MSLLLRFAGEHFPTFSTPTQTLLDNHPSYEGLRSVLARDQGSTFCGSTGYQGSADNDRDDMA